jgi:hypothetical protein
MNSTNQRETAQARIVKIKHHRKGHARVSNETANDERLGGLALGILTYALSKPCDWRLYSWQLAKRFHCGEWAIRTAMTQLRASERVRPVYERAKGGWITAQFWQVRESADLPWPTDANDLNVVTKDKATKDKATIKQTNKEITQKREYKSKEARLSKESLTSRKRNECHSFDLSDYSEQELVLIDDYHSIVCDNDRRWLRVNRYTNALDDGLEPFTYDRDLFRELCIAAVNGDEENWNIPKRRTLTRLVWDNHG